VRGVVGMVLEAYRGGGGGGGGGGYWIGLSAVSKVTMIKGVKREVAT